MKRITVFVTAILLVSASIDTMKAQDVRFYYEGYGGGAYVDLSIGQTAFVNSDADQIGVKFFTQNATIKATRVDGNWQPYPIGSKANYFIYTEQDIPFVLGTDQYEDINIRVECLPKVSTWQELPQPQLWIPIDRKNVNESIPRPPANQRVLTIRRAFIYENAEDLGCPHGPWGSVSLMVYHSKLLSEYNFDFTRIAQNYCGAPDLGDFYNDCNYIRCSTFVHNYPDLGGGVRLPGPIFTAPNDCLIGDDPTSEWIDGPWGAYYSNITVFDWSTTSEFAVALVLREGDETNCDDFMGAMLVNRDMDTILFKAWMGGWIILENKSFPPSADDPYEGEEPSVDVANEYCWHGWDGSYPSEVDFGGYYDANHVYHRRSALGSQYKPYPDIRMAQDSSKESSMVGIFPGSIIKEQVVLNKKMIYRSLPLQGVQTGNKSY